MLVLTFRLNGGLNNIIPRNLLLLVLYCGSSDRKDALQLLSHRFSWNNGLALSNSFYLQDSFNNLLFIILGSFFVIT